MARTGVILAAGFGSRLRGVSDATDLKPLTPVAGTPLLVRAVRSLALAGCERVVIVVGHGGTDVLAGFQEHDVADVDVVFVENTRYQLSNGISVLVARPHLLGDVFVLMMADHIVGDEVMALAAAHEPEARGATLLVDPKLDAIFDMDDATKVLADGRRIVAIGKQIPEYNCVDCGVFVCTTALMEHIDAVYQATGDASLSDGVQALASTEKMAVLDIGDGFWQDVDTPEMLAHAEAELLRRANTGA